jgi:hypothetical protein
MEGNMRLEIKNAVLVYQAGIANVFEVDCFNMSTFGRNARRLLQADFRTCEAFSRGLAAAGVHVYSAHCNMAGDIAMQNWSSNLDGAPFCDRFHPVYNKVAQGA